jgi:hypothetical protein
VRGSKSQRLPDDSRSGWPSCSRWRYPHTQGLSVSIRALVGEKTDLLLPDVLPIVLTRTYRLRDTVSRPFGLGATHPYEMFLVGDTYPYTYVDLILPDGSRVHYDRISPGTGFWDAVYEHVSTPTRFYRSTVSYGGGWDLKLKDGTVYVLQDSGPLQAIRDRYGNQLAITRQGGSGTSPRSPRRMAGGWTLAMTRVTGSPRPRIALGAR